jgi:DNA-binding MarR family transcriptional regulator
MPTATRPADTRIAEQLFGLLPRLGQLWSDAVRDTSGGSVVRMKVLGMLSRNGPTRSGELATFCGTTPSNMTELIEGLVDDGLARRDDDPTDRRAVVIAISRAGQAEVDRVVAAATVNFMKLYDGLTPERRARLRTAINDVSEILASPTASKETRNVR